MAGRFWRERSFWLWVMTIIGVLVIFFFGFCMDSALFKSIAAWLHENGFTIDHPRSWEMGAVVWSFLFGIYYYYSFHWARDEMVNRNIALLVMLGTMGVNACAAWLILRPAWSALWHVGAIFVVGTVFLVADLILARAHKDEPLHRGSYIEGLLVADLPMLVGLFILFWFIFLHDHCKPSMDMNLFAAGAISFQLISSNVIFLISQGGFLRSIWDKHLPPLPTEATSPPLT